MTVVNGFRLVSNSEVQTFKQCRRRWFLAWYLGLAPKYREATGVRNTGSRLHVALEARYQPGKPVPASQVLAALRDTQAEDLEAAAQSPFFDTETATQLAKDFDLEHAMIEGYLQWLEETGADSDLEIIDSEVYLEAELPELEETKIIGKIDTRVRDIRTGKRSFLDHKSVATFKVPMLQQNQQFLHYELLEFLSLEDADARCETTYYNMLRRVKRTAKAKPPFYERAEVRHNQHELRAYRSHLVGTIRDIQMAELRLEDDRNIPTTIYPTPSRDCDWKCEFKAVCRMFDDGSRVDAALEANYDRVNPLDYYQGREEREE